MKINFKLTANTDTEIAVNQIIQKGFGLIVIGEVINGKISKGDFVNIENGEKEPICDKVITIEIFNQAVLSAEKGKKIGICLEKIDKKSILEYLEVEVL